MIDGSPETRATQASRYPRRVAVIGGGISGLAAAFRLRELAAARELPVEVVVLEGSSRLGGSVNTIRDGGLIIETGADSYLAEKPWASELARRLNLESELIGTREEFRKTLVVQAGRLVEIPEGFLLLAPTRFGPFLRSPLFSPIGKLRIALEPLIPRRRDSGDESLASFVTRRLGREMLDRVVQPLAGGIYNADPQSLSLEATMPRFVEMERRYGSLIRGLRAAQKSRAAQQRGTSGARPNMFLTFKGGMRTLTDALAVRLAGCVRSGARVVNLERDVGDGGGWRVNLADGPGVRADGVIMAMPAYAAAELLLPLDPHLAHRLEQITYASVAVVNMAFRAADFPSLPQSSGFVVPAVERRRIIACTFSSLKFTGRAPEGAILMRAFVGGALGSGVMRLDDGGMVAAVREELSALLRLEAEPHLVRVQRWPNAMPQYEVGHLERMAEIERATLALPGLALAGSAYRGVGVPDCIRSGEEAAERILSRLTSEP
jgi:oxygen-dependent protoporphyrinogen oxidase